jgi:toxin YoeB
MREIVFTSRALEDVEWWLQQDRKMLLRILKLIREAAADPFNGTGKPEPLKGALSGAWSRRISQEHRLVYSVTQDRIRVLACRYHYD